MVECLDAFDCVDPRRAGREPEVHGDEVDAPDFRPVDGVERSVDLPHYLEIGLGTGATIGLGLLVGTALPFVMNWLTLLVPSVGMVIAGLLGAYVSQRRITAVGPLVALVSAA